MLPGRAGGWFRPEGAPPQRDGRTPVPPGTQRWRAASTPAEREDIFYRQHALRSVRDELLEHINAAAAADAKQGKQSLWRGLWNTLRTQR